MLQEHKTENSKSKNSQITIISLLSLVIVALFIIEIYEIINDPVNLTAIGAIGGFTLVAVFSETLLICRMNVRNSKDHEDALNHVYRSEKANYLLMRKNFENFDKKIDVLSKQAEIPAKELLSAQKALVKVQINRTKENTDALLVSNDKMIEKINRKLDHAAYSGFSEQDKAVLAENNKDILEKQQELLDGLKELENSLRNEILESADKLASIKTQQVIVQGPQAAQNDDEDLYPLDLEQGSLDLEPLNNESLDLEPLELKSIEPELPELKFMESELPELKSVEPELPGSVSLESESDMFHNSSDLGSLETESLGSDILNDFPELGSLETESLDLDTLNVEKTSANMMDLGKENITSTNSSESALDQLLMGINDGAVDRRKRNDGNKMELPDLPPIMAESTLAQEPSELNLPPITPESEVTQEPSELDLPPIITEPVLSSVEAQPDLSSVGIEESGSASIEAEPELSTISSELDLPSIMTESELSSIAAEPNVSPFKTEPNVSAGAAELESESVSVMPEPESSSIMAEPLPSAVTEPKLSKVMPEPEPSLAASELDLSSIGREEEPSPDIMESELSSVTEKSEESLMISESDIQTAVNSFESSMPLSSEIDQKSYEDVPELIPEKKAETAAAINKELDNRQDYKLEKSNFSMAMAKETPVLDLSSNHIMTPDEISAMIGNTASGKKTDVQPETKVQDLNTNEQIEESELEDEEIDRILKEMDIDSFSGQSLEDMDIDKILEETETKSKAVQKNSSSDSNQVMSSDEIAALIASTDLLEDPAHNSSAPDLSNPNHVMDSDEIAALIASM